MSKRERTDDANPLDDWLTKPALWDGECAEDYLKLHSLFERYMSPSNLFDKIKVQDLVDKLWQEQRLKHSQAALIDSARVESLAQLLSPRFGDKVDEAMETARDYYSGIPERVRPVRTLLAKMGITSKQIEAHALHLRSNGVQALDRMIMYKETTRNAIMKAYEKRQRKAEKEKKKNPVNDNAPTRVPRPIRPVKSG